MELHNKLELEIRKRLLQRDVIQISLEEAQDIINVYKVFDYLVERVNQLGPFYKRASEIEEKLLKSNKVIEGVEKDIKGWKEKAEKIKRTRKSWKISVLLSLIMGLVLGVFISRSIFMANLDSYIDEALQERIE